MTINHDRRKEALDRFLDADEAEHGEITKDELLATTRRVSAHRRGVTGGSVSRGTID